MNTMIPMYRCFYKLPNEDGWHINLGDITQDNIEEQFKKAKEEGRIVEYDFFESGRRNPKFTKDSSLDNTSYWMALRDYWGYSPDTEAWYAETELLPEPQGKTEITNDFQISYEIEDEDDLIEYITDLKSDNENDAGLPINLNFSTQSQQAFIVLEYRLMLDELKQFLDNVEQFKSVRLYIYEYSEHSFHIWQKENNTIRFAIQNSLNNGLIFSFDVTIPKDIFILQFNNILVEIENQIKQH